MPLVKAQNALRKQKNMAQNDFQYGGWNSYTMQCGRWLQDDMPLNSPKHPPYWNSTSGFDFDHITAVDMSFCISLRNFIQIGPPSAEKYDVMSICNMADIRHCKGVRCLPIFSLSNLINAGWLVRKCVKNIYPLIAGTNRKAYLLHASFALKDSHCQ